jgi:antibiotic biosynthesis monooxygenase (ABM) superfamily enzyme
MAAVTYVGVYFVTLPLMLTLNPLLTGWPLPLANATFNLVVVPLLTWGVMPVLTQVARPWLQRTLT